MDGKTWKWYCNVVLASQSDSSHGLGNLGNLCVGGPGTGTTFTPATNQALISCVSLTQALCLCLQYDNQLSQYVSDHVRVIIAPLETRHLWDLLRSLLKNISISPDSIFPSSALYHCTPSIHHLCMIKLPYTLINSIFHGLMNL